MATGWPWRNESIPEIERGSTRSLCPEKWLWNEEAMDLSLTIAVQVFTWKKWDEPTRIPSQCRWSHARELKCALSEYKSRAVPPRRTVRSNVASDKKCHNICSKCNWQLLLFISGIPLGEVDKTRKNVGIKCLSAGIWVESLPFIKQELRQLYCDRRLT